MSHAIILFDGVCNLCNRAVQSVIKADPHAYFKFASLQSPVARQLLAGHFFSKLPDSIVLLEDGVVYIASSAVLRIARRLRWPYPLLYGLKIIPAFLRDSIYRFIATHRYRWFGRKANCMVPDVNVLERFLETEL